MQNPPTIISCFFLHDSLMAAMEEEQTVFRRHFLAANHKTPFNPLPPLCPYQKIHTTEAFEIATLTIDSGWIVRPVTPLSPLFEQSSLPLSPPLQLPGFPPFPKTPGFILGYAGNEAECLLSKLHPSQGKLPEPPFHVRVWYWATVTIAYGFNEKNGTMDSRWEIGKKQWERAKRVTG